MTADDREIAHMETQAPIISVLYVLGLITLMAVAWPFALVQWLATPRPGRRVN